MLPMLQQCYESALTAKSLAQSIKRGAIAPLPVALSTTINIALLITFLTELVRVLPGLELRFHRGSNAEIAELLKKGDAEVAVAGPLNETWDRLDSWLLFKEPYRLAVGLDHRLAPSAEPVAPAELRKERLICRKNCDNLQELMDFLTHSGGLPDLRHEFFTEQDLTSILHAGLGVALMPQSSAASSHTKALGLQGLNVHRDVYVYGVAGRQRSTAANTLIKMLRAADWREQETVAPGGTSAATSAASSKPLKSAHS